MKDGEKALGQRDHRLLTEYGIRHPSGKERFLPCIRQRGSLAACFFMVFPTLDSCHHPHSKALVPCQYGGPCRRETHLSKASSTMSLISIDVSTLWPWDIAGRVIHRHSVNTSLDRAKRRIPTRTVCPENSLVPAHGRVSSAGRTVAALSSRSLNGRRQLIVGSRGSAQV